MPVDFHTTDSTPVYTFTVPAPTEESYSTLPSDLAAGSAITLSEDVLPWASTQSHAESSTAPEKEWTNAETAAFSEVYSTIDYLCTKIERLEGEVDRLRGTLSRYTDESYIRTITEKLCNLFQWHFEMEQFVITPDEIDPLLRGF